jgi:putative ATPase
LYDKEGDAHFDTISAFIKSLRGSDPDATLYWLAKMVYAGEDPRLLFRRMLILASEDVGLADPNAVVTVSACATAFDRIGMPEGRFHLAQAALYLATAPKSNSTLGFFDALKAVKDEREAEVPSPLRDGSRDKEGFGHGEGYLYPHAYRDHWVAQQYLPSAMQGRVFYEPSDQGYEGAVRVSVERRRETQLAAMGEGEGIGPTQRLTYGPRDLDSERWLQRAVSQTGAHLGRLRDHLTGALDLARHHVVLDLDAGSGLMTWEALRAVPEGGVWSLAAEPSQAASLDEQAQRLPELRRPRVIVGDLSELAKLAGGQLFDRIVGRNALCRRSDKAGAAKLIAGCLAAGGKVALAEYLPRGSQRISELVEADKDRSALWARWHAAEIRALSSPNEGLTSWDGHELNQHFTDAGLVTVLSALEVVQDLFVSQGLVERWLSRDDAGSYAQRLAAELPDEDREAVAGWVRGALVGRTVRWRSHYVTVVAVRAAS